MAHTIATAPEIELLLGAMLHNMVWSLFHTKALPLQPPPRCRDKREIRERRDPLCNPPFSYRNACINICGNIFLWQPEATKIFQHKFSELR